MTDNTAPLTPEEPPTTRAGTSLVLSLFRDHNVLAAVQVAAIEREAGRGLCLVASNSGPNGEPLLCGFTARHDGNHSWATLPTFDQARADTPSIGERR